MIGHSEWFYLEQLWRYLADPGCRTLALTIQMQTNTGQP